MEKTKRSPWVYLSAWPTSWQQNSWHRYRSKKSCQCYPTYVHFISNSYTCKLWCQHSGAACLWFRELCTLEMFDLFWCHRWVTGRLWIRQLSIHRVLWSPTQLATSFLIIIFLANVHVTHRRTFLVRWKCCKQTSHQLLTETRIPSGIWSRLNGLLTQSKICAPP